MRDIQIITAASILGLKPLGVENLPASLLSNGLLKKLDSTNEILELPTLNQFYSPVGKNHEVLNQEKLKEFSITLHNVILQTLDAGKFPLVLGGDCSILIGIMSGLKASGSFGLFFLDGHADFYQPEKSVSGEAADMDLAIVCGRGPDVLTNMFNLKPYVLEKNVIHIGQRDWEETREYGSQDIKDSEIKCIDCSTIQKVGIENSLSLIKSYVDNLNVDSFWIHFDTDVLSDNENPAVDYRLKGGLSFKECQAILKWLCTNQKIAGMTVTIFNPSLDKDGSIAQRITQCVSKAVT